MLTEASSGSRGRSGGRGLSAVRWCSTVCAHLPIISVDNRIWFTVFSPCCFTHRSDQRLTGHSGAFWRFLGIVFFSSVVCFFSPPDSQIFKGVIVKYNPREADLSGLLERQTVKNFLGHFPDTDYSQSRN